MFSQRLAQAKLEQISQKTGWIPEYHTVAYIESFEAHFKELGRKAEDADIDLESMLGYEELAHIDNEYRICCADYRYWSENYAFINANGKIQRYQRRATQKMLLELWAERNDANLAIEQQILKARQQGISTEVEVAITHMINFGIGVKAAIASYDADACERMGGMMQLCYNEMPSWMRANPTSDRAGSLMAFGGNNTRMTLYSGKKAAGIARGDTPSVIHISEVSIFPNAADVIANSLYNSVHPTPQTFMVLESTGNGNTNWWAKEWYSSRDYWASGGARLQPVFFPWFLADDIFPTEADRRQHPVPAGFEADMLPETRRMMAKAAAYVHQTPLLRRFMGQDWRMPIWQAYFWEWKLREYRRNDNENGWYQEMPMDDCVTGDTRISTERGIIRIDRASYALKTESGTIEAWIPKGKREIYEVHTHDGRIVRGTPEHRIQTGEGWTKIIDLKPGDPLTLAQLKFAEVPYIHRWNDTKLFQCEKKVDRRFGRFLGYFMGDGCFNSTTVDIACDAKDFDVVEDVCGLLEELSDHKAHIQRVGGLARVKSHNAYWRPLLESMGCLKPKMHVEGRICGVTRKVCVPEAILCSPKPIVREFLSALFECDGHANRGTPRVSLYSAHDDFLRDVQILLLGFGIRSKLDCLQKKHSDGHTYLGRELSIPAPFVNLFYEEVGFISTRKQSSGLRRNKARAGHSPYSEFSDSVKEVISTAELEDVYDLTIAKTHRFAANGIMVHNCEALRPEKELYFSLTENEKQDQDRSGYTVWSIIGEQIPVRLHPDPVEILTGVDRFRVEYNGHVHDLRGRQNKTFEWEFIPLLQPIEKGVELFDVNNKLLVFEWPEEGYDYSIGVDNSGGTKQDNSIIAVNRHSLRGNEPDVVCATFTSSTINPSMMHTYVMAIAALYKCEMEPGREPLVGIEQVYGMGDVTQVQMLGMGYKRMYKFSRLDGKNPNKDKKTSKKLGWYTFDWSRNFMLALLKNAHENHWLRFNDPFVIKQEIPSFQADQTEGGKTKFEHEQGKKDDRIFAIGIAFVIMNDTESMTRRLEKPFEGDDESEADTNYDFPLGYNVPYATLEQELDL